MANVAAVATILDINLILAMGSFYHKPTARIKGFGVRDVQN